MTASTRQGTCSSLLHLSCPRNFSLIAKVVYSTLSEGHVRCIVIQGSVGRREVGVHPQPCTAAVDAVVAQGLNRRMVSPEIFNSIEPIEAHIVAVRVAGGFGNDRGEKL